MCLIPNRPIYRASVMFTLPSTSFDFFYTEIETSTLSESFVRVLCSVSHCIYLCINHGHRDIRWKTCTLYFAEHALCVCALKFHFSFDGRCGAFAKAATAAAVAVWKEGLLIDALLLDVIEDQRCCRWRSMVILQLTSADIALCRL